MTDILMGPVLSFRGAEKNTWRVTAMIVIAADADAPALVLEDKPGGKPVALLQNETRKILRYELSVELDKDERRVAYGFGPQSWEFTVPGEGAVPRMAYVSCNGFSEPDAVRNSRKPLFAVWSDLLCNHDRKFRRLDYQVDKEQRWHEELVHDKGLQRFHLLLMGGDQIYFDSIWTERERLPKLSEWTELSFDEQVEFSLTDELKLAIRSYYEDLYIDRWRPRRDPQWGATGSEDRGSAAAMASIPTIMMWDDHDIFDGWGSYPPELQYCALFQHLFAEARRAFWIYQLQQRESDLPALNDRCIGAGIRSDAPDLEPVQWTQRLKGDSLGLPFLENQPGFSYSFCVGPIAMLVLDLRSERSQKQIMGEATWDALQRRLHDLCGGAEHVLLMSSVPVAYPKLGLADIGLGIAGWFGSSKGSPDVIEGLADDLNDHWTHRSHEGELKRFIRVTIAAAQEHKVRLTILSGDVHVASWGTIVRKDAMSAENWMRINQLTSSSVVHPPPAGLGEELFLSYVARMARSDQDIDTDYMIKMMQFPGSDDYVYPHRNWLALELDRTPFAKTEKRRLWATWRCEGNPRFSNHLNAIHPVGVQQDDKTAKKPEPKSGRSSRKRAAA